MTDSRTNAQQQSTNHSRIYDLAEDSRLVFKDTHLPVRLDLDSAITVSVTSSEVVLFSPSFTADPTILSLGAGAWWAWRRERRGDVWAPLLGHAGATAGYMAVYVVCVC